MFAEIKQSFRENDIIIKLVYINVAIFLLVRIADFAAIGGGYSTGWLAFEWLSLPVSSAVIFRPWTPLSYMFTHYDLVHFLFNLFALYWFGRIFMMTIDNERRAIKAYVVGGLAGAVASSLMCLLQSHGGLLIGASGSIMSLLLAATISQPDMRLWVTFFGEVRLKYIALVYVLLDVIFLASMDNVGGHLAHLGGALAGAALAWYWKNSKATASSTLGAILGRKPKMTVTRGGNPDWDYNQRRHDVEREVDRILDKIKERGYDSLTNAEKQTLFDQSKRD